MSGERAASERLSPCTPMLDVACGSLYRAARSAMRVTRHGSANSFSDSRIIERSEFRSKSSSEFKLLLLSRRPPADRRARSRVAVEGSPVELQTSPSDIAIRQVAAKNCQAVRSHPASEPVRRLLPHQGTFSRSTLARRRDGAFFPASFSSSESSANGDEG